MNKLTRGIAIGAAGAGLSAGVIAMGAEQAFAHHAELEAVAACADGLSPTSNPEATLAFIGFDDQVGKTVNVYLNQVNNGTTPVYSHEVTANEPNFEAKIQTAAGKVGLKAVWGSNIQTFSFDIKSCEVPTTTSTSTTTTTTEVPVVTTTTPDTTPDTIVYGDDTSVVEVTTTTSTTTTAPPKPVATLPATL